MDWFNRGMAADHAHFERQQRERLRELFQKYGELADEAWEVKQDEIKKYYSQKVSEHLKGKSTEELENTYQHIRWVPLLERQELFYALYEKPPLSVPASIDQKVQKIYKASEEEKDEASRFVYATLLSHMASTDHSIYIMPLIEKHREEAQRFERRKALAESALAALTEHAQRPLDFSGE